MFLLNTSSAGQIRCGRILPYNQFSNYSCRMRRAGYIHTYLQWINGFWCTLLKLWVDRGILNWFEWTSRDITRILVQSKVSKMKGKTDFGNTSKKTNINWDHTRLNIEFEFEEIEFKSWGRSWMLRGKKKELRGSLMASKSSESKYNLDSSNRMGVHIQSELQFWGRFWGRLWN
jgi:hypothetical protein